jgi:hypothetical protein
MGGYSRVLPTSTPEMARQFNVSAALVRRAHLPVLWWVLRGYSRYSVGTPLVLQVLQGYSDGTPCTPRVLNEYSKGTPGTPGGYSRGTPWVLHACLGCTSVLNAALVERINLHEQASSLHPSGLSQVGLAHVCTGTGAHPCHIRTGTGAHPLPHLHRDWAHPYHTFTRTGAHPFHFCAGT